MMKTWMLVAACAAGVAAQASASISYTGGAYGENFNSLPSTTNNSATAYTWANDSTIPGWSLFNSTGAAIASHNAHAGGSNTGAFSSLGTASASDRALGGVGSGGAYFGSPATGTIAGWITVAITNNTAGTLDSFTLGFDGEQWRDGGAATPAAQTMVLEYGYGATFAAVTTWNTPGGAFNWSSPVFTNTGAGAAVDGNVAGLVSGRGGTIASQTWAPGDTLWVRWVERNDSGNDHALAIDNFSFSATPTPGSLALLGLAGALAGRRRR